MVPIRLTIAKGAQVGAEAVFEQSEILIGRTDENDVVLIQSGVSREHARIFVDAGGVWVEDLNSANGTYLNGNRLEKPCRLSNGDSLGVGSVVLDVGLLKRPAPPEPEPEPSVSATHILGDRDGPAPVRRPSVEASYDDSDEGLGESTAPLAGGSLGGRAAALQPVARRVSPVASRAAAATAFDLADEETGAGASAGVANADDTESGAGHTVPSDPDEVQAAFEAAATHLSEVPVDEPSDVSALEAQPTRLTDLGDNAKAMVVAASRGSGLLERVQTRMLEIPVIAKVRNARRERGGDPDGVVPLAGAGKLGGRMAKMDAVERARLRRELQDTLGGQLRLWWLNLDAGPRRITLATLLLVLVTFGGVLWFVFKPEPTGPQGPVGPEPTALSSTPLNATFGWGSGVQWEHLTEKAFDFEFVAPTRVVAVLHFEAANIEAGEVAIILNGTEIGEVEADTEGIRDREHERVLPLLHLRSGEPNKVIFENRLNPSGRSTWQISRPWVEIIPVPELSDPELITAAREHAGRGRGFAEMQTVGSDNLFKAWKAYRAAWITLEPLSEPPQLYHDVRFRMGQLKAELDTLCGGLILDFERAMQFSQRRKAKGILQDILQHFPTPEHRCHNQAQQRFAEHAL